MRNFVKIHPRDMAAVALSSLPAGSVLEVDGEKIILSSDIPQGHKFALRDISEEEKILKYGSPIGIATRAIKKGDWIHTHNMKTALDGIVSYSYEPADASFPEVNMPFPENDASFPEAGTRRTFQGYRRKDGRAGVRNEIWILPTVGCVNNVATAIERRSQQLCSRHLVKGTIDAIAAFPHPYGCSQMGQDQENTRKILADLIRHPNAGGVLVLGLGCENSNIEVLKTYLGEYDEERVRFLTAQETEDEIEDGLKLVEELAEYASRFEREPISCSELIVGMKCGGSDGLSGITANPTVGVFSDRLITRGGTTILTEVPEMFGAETLLMNRCESRELFQETVALVNDFKNYFMSHGQAVYENPSPGNKKGGISTLEDKSLGCTQKSGSAPVRGVLAYGERVTAKGLNLLSAPGNDLVASTALAAAGAQIVLFTTGRGTPFACPVPTVKISSNTPLSARKKNWIDFDCGPVTEGKVLPELGDQLFEFVLAVACGKKVKAEEAGFHDMAIFKRGVTL